MKIRLQRRGRKKLPVYKIVAADSRAPRDGRFIEALGQYAPVSKDAQLTVDRERVLYWLGKGARPSDTVRSLLSREGIMLHVHLQRKGKSPEDIESTLAAWLEARNVRAARQSTKKQQRTARKKAAEAVKTEETAAPASEAEAATASEASPEG